MSLRALHEAFGARDRHLSPFFVLGDPDPETSLELIEAAVEAGASMLELGIPFSDPVADGPAIQAAGARARASGTSVAQALELLRRVRERVDVPFNLLVYGNLVHAAGYRAFAADLVRAGASSLLVPDIPFEEVGPLRRACALAELGLVHFVGPHTDPERARRLSRDATAFVYLAGHQGVTGTGRSAPGAALSAIAAAVEGPLAVGFGIRSANDVRGVFESGARVAVVGSALAARIAAGLDAGRAALVADLREQIAHLVAASAPPQDPRSDRSEACSSS